MKFEINPKDKTVFLREGIKMSYIEMLMRLIGKDWSGWRIAPADVCMEDSFTEEFRQHVLWPYRKHWQVYGSAYDKGHFLIDTNDMDLPSHINVTNLFQ